MKSNLKINVIGIAILFSVALVAVIYFVYQRNINVLREELLKEYLAVYVETRKDHLKDLINHICRDINSEREKLRIKAENELSRCVKVTKSIIDALNNNKQSKEIFRVINGMNNILYGKHIGIFIINKKTKTFIVKPNFGLDEKTLIQDGNSRFISKYIVYGPKGWIVGAVVDYKKCENDLKKYVLNRLYHFRYGLENEGYFFVVTIERKKGKIVTIRTLNPNKPKSTIGKIIPLNIKDIKGKKFHREMVRKCLTKGQGFVEYYFKIPGTNKIDEKISFVKYYKPWHWMIGTGFYLTIFESKLEKKNRVLQSMIRKRNKKFLLLLILSFGIMTFLFVYIVSLLIRETNIYIKRIKEDNKFKQKLIYMIPNPMFFSDEKGNILECNEDFKEIFGVQRKHGCKSLKNSHLENLENKLKQILKESKSKNKDIPEFVEVDIETEGKKKRIFEMYISKLRYKEKLSGFVCVLIDITDKKENQEKLYKASIKDELTNAFNRRYLRNLFPLEHKKAKDKDYKISIIMFDVDFFKKVNDTYGHDIGDKVLKKVVEIAEKHIRKEDFLFRTGGEEFVIMLAGADKDKAYQIAEEIREDIKRYIFEEGFSVTVSFGITEVKEDDSLETALKRADMALYESKSRGRDRTSFI